MKLKKIIAAILAVSVLLSLQINSYADEIRLKNADRITGEIVKEDSETVIIKTEAMGSIPIKRAFIQQIISDKKPVLAQTKETTPKLWQRETSLGYNQANGNTENSQLSLNLYANRKTEDDEFTIKGNSFYSSSNKKMDTQKWYTMARYAFSVRERKWYNFYRLEADHDKFANIDYRLVPAVGLGYWYSDTARWKAMLESALGLEHTNFKQGTKDSNEAVFIPRAFFQVALFGESKLSQDLSLYSPLSDIGEYRLHSKTIFENPINDKLLLRLSLINDYDANPPKETKKKDLRFISSLVYSF